MEAQHRTLAQFLTAQTPFQLGKPHFATMGMIERELGSDACPYLKLPELRTVRHIGIEQETRQHLRQTLYGKIPPPLPLVIAPYPSYVSLIPSQEKEFSQKLYAHARPVMVLLAAGT